MPHRRLRALLALTAFALMVAASTRAQAVAGDTLVFERVGDEPLDAHDLAFDETGALWAIDADVWRLPPGGTEWEEITLITAHHILPLGPDTLLAGGLVSVRRSLDRGRTWAQVHDEGGALFAAPLSGTVVAGTSAVPGVAYSHDRGTTWTPGTLDVPGVARAVAFAELPEGHEHAGRLVAACKAGLSYSDDRGVTWRVSDLWAEIRYFVPSVTVGADGRVYAALTDASRPGTQIAVSEDGGETYEIAYEFGVPVGTEDRIVSLPGGKNPEVGVLVLVKYDGSVWRSDDGPASWRQAGQVPFVHPFPSGRLRDAVLDPGGWLYVAGGAVGPDKEWVWRTTTPVVTAQEPAPPEETGVRLEVSPNPLRNAARVTFDVAEAAHVRLAVYDVLGREVAVLAEGPHLPGRHEVRLDGRGLAAGRYLVRASVEAAGEARAFVERITVLR